MLPPSGICHFIKHCGAHRIERRPIQCELPVAFRPLPWLSPYTDKVLEELPGQGVKHLVVASPFFVVDNLETLEEIGIQGRETFLEAGGESFHLVPCLNADPLWVSGLAKLCRGAA